MDQLDAALLRELMRDRTLLWGGHDPRLGTSDIARRLGVDRTTVWARLKAWKEAGFLLRQEVFPNPSLFGVGVAGGDLRVADPRKKAQVIDSIQLVDGVLSGLDLVGDYLVILYAHENEAALERCTTLLAQLPDVDEVSMCIPFDAPTSSVELSKADWRILRSLRALPEASLGDIAEHAGMSTRTFRRRYTELLNSSALWSFPLFDFSKYQGAVIARFAAMLSGPEHLPAFTNHIRKELASHVWVLSMELELPEAGGRMGGADIFCQLGSAAEADDVRAWILDQDTVVEAHTSFPRAWFAVGPWFDDRIAQKLKA